MKKSILKQIYYGETDFEFFRFSKEWKAAGKRMCESYDKLKEHLTNEQVREVEEHLNDITALHSEELWTYYKEGFAVGFGIALECAEKLWR